MELSDLVDKEFYKRTSKNIMQIAKDAPEKTKNYLATYPGKVVDNLPYTSFAALLYAGSRIPAEFLTIADMSIQKSFWSNLGLVGALVAFGPELAILAKKKIKEKPLKLFGKELPDYARNVRRKVVAGGGSFAGKFGWYYMLGADTTENIITSSIVAGITVYLEDAIPKFLEEKSTYTRKVLIGSAATLIIGSYAVKYKLSTEKKALEDQQYRNEYKLDLEEQNERLQEKRRSVPIIQIPQYQSHNELVKQSA